MTLEDRFDICEAYYLYMVFWNINGVTERYHSRKRKITISQQLHNVGFKPAPSGLADVEDLTENGQNIYNGLIEKYETYA